MYISFIFFLSFLSSLATASNIKEGTTNKRLKLSDLPVLKKWEIPNHQFSKHVGRKYKDLERETKRSTYWELKPDFTAGELEWDEDPEKIKLDFNYKDFLEEDEEHDVERALLTNKVKVEKSPLVEVTGDKRSLPKQQTSKITKLNKKKKHNVERALLTNKVKVEKSPLVEVTGDKRSLRKQQTPKTTTTLKNKKKHVNDKTKSKHSNDKTKSKHPISRRSLDVIDMVLNEDEDFKDITAENIRSRRSLVEDERLKRALVDTRNGEEEDDLFFPNRFFTDMIDDGDEVDNEIRAKRAAIWDAVRRLQLSQGEQQKQQQQQQQKRAVIQQKQLINKKQPRHEIFHYPTPLIARKNIAKSAIPNALIKRSHIMAQKLPVATEIKEQKTQRSVIEKHKKSGDIGDEQVKRNKIRTLDHVKATRQNIDRPDSIDPSNVARAVTMAMEQLKRDKMWGKVFVHVKPSGQLKVMVQETKKMDEKK